MRKHPERQRPRDEARQEEAHRRKRGGRQGRQSRLRSPCETTRLVAREPKRSGDDGRRKRGGPPTRRRGRARRREATAVAETPKNAVASAASIASGDRNLRREGQRRTLNHRGAHTEALITCDSEWVYPRSVVGSNLTRQTSSV